VEDPLVGLCRRGEGCEQKGKARPPECTHDQAAEKETLGAVWIVWSSSW
jgi:hypothetical protein